MNTGADFVHLHVHSEYSLLDGAARIKDVVAQAKNLGMPALAITDHGSMFGVVDFYKTCRQAGIKPILGCEVYVAPRGMTDRVPKIDDHLYHLVLLAENQTGYQNLLKLVSLGYTEGFYYKPRVDKDTLNRYSKGLIALSACLAGEVADRILAGEPARARQAAAQYREIFGRENFYLELQNHGFADQQTVNRELLKINGEMGIPLVATNDVHYVGQGDAGIQDVLLCIQTGRTIHDQGRMKFQSAELYLKDYREMYLLFGEIPQVLSRTTEIARRCQVELAFGRYHLPDYQVPAGCTVSGYLTDLCDRGAVRRYGHCTGVVQERLNYELSVIHQMGFEAYFLIVWDFIKFARERGIPVGPGRGSAAGSIVAYVLEITNIDPLQYGLLFERFLNPERISMPDIDIDLCYQRRGEVIDYVVAKYGVDKVSQIITFGTMAARAAIRDVGRALDLPYGEVDRVAKLVPPELNMTIRRAQEQSPELKAMYDQSTEVKKLIDTAMGLEGMPRHASTHAAGVVIARETLTNYVPLYKSSDGSVTTQFPMGTVEELGLLKMDLLGLRNLTVIGDAIALIKQNRGIQLELDNLPLDDQSTFDLLARGEGTGVFQLESSGMRTVLKELKPAAFEDVIPLVALYRPGPLGSGMVDDYIRRKHGLVKVDYFHPDLEPVLKDTYGVILYQEQVMKIAQIMAGYSLGQADALRKAMGKKIPEMMGRHREWFVHGSQVDEKGRPLARPIPGAVARGYGQDLAVKMFDLMEYFAGYGFNKSHSAAYGLVVYQTAYLKANYSLEYMAALLSSVRDNTDKVVIYIEECRRMGLPVLPPDVNESDQNFTVLNNRIRFGLAAVKNVGLSAIQEIIRNRTAQGRFNDFQDFCRRLDVRLVNRRVLESLIKCGALDSLGQHRAQMLAGLDLAVEFAQRCQRERDSGQISLFDLMDEGESNDFTLPPVQPLSQRELLAMEKETLGLYISGHPLGEYRELLKSWVSHPMTDLPELADGQLITMGGLVTAMKRITARKGGQMAFVTLEDLSGSGEVVVFAGVFHKSLAALQSGSPIWVKGRVSKNDEETKILADEIRVLADLPVDLYLQVPWADQVKLAAVKAILKQNPGRAAVKLYDPVQHKTESLPAEYKVDLHDTLVKQLLALLGADNLKIKSPAALRQPDLPASLLEL